MSEDCRPTVRGLMAWEIQEARRVFLDQINYEAVRVHECTPWPDQINRFGTWIKRMPPPDRHNAITLGNHCYFPVPLLKEPLTPALAGLELFSWLIHELTHVWQFQKMGWRYLALALQAQVSEGAEAYQFGYESGLIEAFAKGRKFSDFNLEQQGDIARYYYERLARGQDIRAWNPFIAQLQGVEPPIAVA
jgi:type VI secretion system secreted protein VgrG